MFLCVAPVEIVGIASVMPFLAVLANPEVVESNEYLAAVYAYMEFSNKQNFFVFLAGCLFLGFVLTIGVQMVKQYSIIHFSHKRIATISSRLLSIYLHQPYAWFLHQHSSDLGKTLLTEVGQVVGGVVMPALKLLSEVLTAVFMIGFMVVVDPVVAAIAFTLVGGSYGLIYWVARNFLERIGKARVKANQERYRYAQEAVGAIKDVKVFSLEETYVGLFREPAHRFARNNIANLIVQSVPSQLLQVFVFGGMLTLVMWMLASQDGDLGAVIPVIGLYALAGRRLLPAIKQIFNSFVSLRFNGPAIELLYNDMKLAQSQMQTETETGERLNLKHSLNLDDVHFTFDQAPRPALDGLSLSIKANTTVGFVGTTGAGKTTAVDLIMGLLAPQQGTVRVDDVVINDDNVRAWRRSLGYVPQQIFLSDDTIAGNIAFGVATDKIDMAAVERAARMAELQDFVSSDLPEGYLTMVGERGVRLSGGQRQRIGIARALYHDPDVLILDEATSALDNVTERAVMAAIQNVANTKTIILVAHRLTTVEQCDNIFLLDSGGLAATGTYAELLEKSPAFKAMATHEKNHDKQ